MIILSQIFIADLPSGETVKQLKTLSNVGKYTQRYLKSKVLVGHLKLLKTQEIPEQFETVLLTTV